MKGRGRVGVAALLAALTGCGGGTTAAPQASTPSATPSPASPTMPPDESATSAPTLWSRVLERDASGVHREPVWHDPRDVPVDWVDVTRVRYSDGGGGQWGWTIKLAASPPPSAGLAPGRLIAYGLVLETTGDNAADYLIGIDNDVTMPRDFHVWVTDLARGETDEQIGPPYGVPIEFRYPFRWRDQEDLLPRSMFFTFLSSVPSPADLDPETVRFYAWAGTARDGEVVALDYAPDTGWMTMP